uniref:Olfactomedin-4-like n=1 Tax=Lepisosteus oculatus TaxID=7918 RepID=W5M6I5_LEPOC|nr:PREDICTED: olfactomedin-4-like [Lepisosteus oculatus]
MKPSFIFSAVTAVVLCSLLKSWVSAQVSKACFCELQNLGQAFPSDKLEEILRTSTACTRSATEEQLTEVETLLDSLHYRLLDLEKDVKDLEEAKDEGMYGIISLRIIEIELNEISDLLIRLNSTTRNHQALTVNLGPQLRNLRTELGKLADFDRMQVVKKEQENKRLKRHLSVCETDLRMTPAPHKDPAPGNCPFGRLLNVTGPTSSMLTEYDSSYPYGAWGKDPKPAPGKESWYWLVVLTSSSCYGSFVRTYTSRSAQIVAQYAGDVIVTSSVTTTNSIMGPGSVMYNNAYYYNCYYSPNVCRFDMETKTITTRALPGAGANGKFPYCHLTACYSCTDIDLSTDESGLWVIYASEENFGNVVLSRLNATSTLDILETWRTSLVKKAVTNAFVACGVLYATRLVNNNYEEIFYSFDTVTGIERGNLSIRFRKPSAYIYSLNYNPRDRNLYAYNDAYIVTYQTVFG